MPADTILDAAVIAVALVVLLAAPAAAIWRRRERGRDPRTRPLRGRRSRP